jgi:hypothetical protein
MTAFCRGFSHLERLKVADQRPIVRSEPVIPLDTAEFDNDGLADGRQRVISVESGCGAVAVDSVCLLPPLSSGGAQVTEP